MGGHNLETKLPFSKVRLSPTRALTSCVISVEYGIKLVPHLRCYAKINNIVSYMARGALEGLALPEFVGACQPLKNVHPTMARPSFNYTTDAAMMAMHVC